ncbi:MAG: hypothetical protein A3I31_03165 [Candidatus Colwellbacteria bacterium RIFCSPLOWO2_02_FULL_44_20b]|uniref:AAA+ ATPase domain-containing protein n=1 Tax=Candidatus Colwellbacteria bacterium RIFCSPLOWO2_02_FULL_44_20b TaxID=1797691 RepID=A0A1G1Z6T8_9BACT|nr:MAG: hypothetical protein A3I31_03165 [Candidatus Colwellbacteria bacterium RIFCSPLOWO2_02_FULL_44_20b]
MLEIPPQKLRELLVGESLMAGDAFDAIAQEAERFHQSLSDTLISRGLITREYFEDLLVKYFNVQKADLERRGIDLETLSILPEELSRRRRVIAFKREGDNSVDVAMEDPSDLETVEYLERYLKAQINSFLASANDLNKGFSLYGRQSSENFQKLIEEHVLASLKSQAQGEEEKAEEVPIVSIVDNIVSYAISLRASDIHLEIFNDLVLIRYRVDGILYEIVRVRKEVFPAIVARLKLLSGMKIDEHSKPQDGRFRYKVGTDQVDIRVSIMPTFYGEKVEMRLLTGADRPLSFAELGMLDDTIKIIEENIKKSYGMFLVCGPTGSGKTTTLYAVLGKLNRPQVNIVTIEDPIEYDIAYVNQTQVNTLAGINFASGLRAFLRQDPNIIMVGEIRDEETAEISVQAALTGHLVLSSLHTNDAPTAIPRFVDMKIPPFLVSAVLNVLIAQRLVRRICTNCIISYPAPEEVTAALKVQVKKLGVENYVKIPETLYKGKGCSVCNGSGYAGRMGIFETLNVNEDVRKIIINPDFSLDALRTVARGQGMITMFEDGIRKVEKGMTTLEEVLRVIRE